MVFPPTSYVNQPIKEQFQGAPLQAPPPPHSLEVSAVLIGGPRAHLLTGTRKSEPGLANRRCLSI